MDEQAKIEEARAAGYTDEEINQYLATKDQPVAQQTPMNRSEEYTGLAQGIGGATAVKALEYGIPAAGAAYGVKKITDMVRGPVAPTQAVQAIPAVQQTTQQVVNGRPNLTVTQGGMSNLQQGVNDMIRTPTQQPSMLQQGMEYSNKVRQIAMNKVMQGAGMLSKALPAATVGANLYGTSPEEIAVLKAAEEKRKRQGLPF